MILYLDASAIVKRYVSEPGSREVLALTGAALVVATAIVSRAEVAAALARAVRLAVIGAAGGRRAQQRFAEEWVDFVRVPATEALVARAETLAWSHALRGYDAMHLAAALTWQEVVGAEVVLATYDHQLWSAGAAAGLRPWPAQLRA